MNRKHTFLIAVVFALFGAIAGHCMVLATEDHGREIAE